MLYTDKELQKAKIALEPCTFVSPSTKGCYSSRIALWIHYCNKYCGGDDRVTDVRLADYLEWMVGSGTADAIRQGDTYIQQVLRNQLQGVTCYWRIQNDDRADVPDPRKSRVYLSKWHNIVQRYPQQRQPRNKAAANGAHSSNNNNTANAPVIRPSYPAAVPPTSNWRPAISGPSGGAGSRPIPATGHQQHIQAAPHYRYPHATNDAMEGGQYQTEIPRGPPTMVSPTAYRYANMPPQPRIGSTVNHPLASKRFIVPQVPSLQPASQAHITNSFEPSRASSISLDYEDDARVDGGERVNNIYQRAPSRPSAHASQQVSKHDALAHMSKKGLNGELPSEMPEWIASATRSPEGYLLVPEEVAALNLRQLEMNNYQQCQARAFYNLGLASWLSTKQRSALTLADVFMDESSTLAIQEQQVLLPLMQPAPTQPATTQPAPVQPEPVQPATTSAQVEELAPEAANDNSEERPIPNSAPTTPERQVAEVVSRKAGSLPPPSSASLPASLPQDSSEKAAPAASSASTDPPAEPVAATTSAANPALAATVSPARAISVAIHSPGSSRIGKTQVLRHSNPLLCTWNALAICFFRKWHVAGEPTPDFGSPQWLSERLFTGASGASADMIAEDFEMAFKDACHDISSDSLTGSEIMSDSAYFYADAFKLTHASVDGIKGLSCVDAIDTELLLPEIAIALIRANAGYSPASKEPVKAPARFGVIPSQALQREIFPWIMPMLSAVLQQKSNNSQVLMATRFLSMLKKLRMVLLQDVAFLMEVPLLSSTFAVHRPFEGKLFTSPAFLAYRAEMRQALGATEIREMEEYCIITQRWIKGRKQALPRGDPKRLKPTTARIMQPAFFPPPNSNRIIAASMAMPHSAIANGAPKVLSVASSLGYSESVIGSKRTYGPSLNQDPSNGNDNMHLVETGAGSDVPMLITKRARHGYEVPKAMQQTHHDDDVLDVLEVPEPEHIVDAGTDEQPLGHVTAAIDELRMENEDLRYQMSRIENTLTQQQSEFRSWMSRIERAIQGSTQVAVQPRSVSPDIESAAQYYPGAATVPGQPPSAHLQHHHPAYPSQAHAQQQMYQSRQQARPPQLPSQQPQRAYADGRYQQPATAHRQSSEMPAPHGGASHYDGGMYRGSGGGVAESQAASASHGHFTVHRTKQGAPQQHQLAQALTQAQAQAQASMAHSGHPGATPQMQHVSYSKNPQRVQHTQYAQHAQHTQHAQHAQPPAAQGYSPRRAYADQRGAPQSHYPSAHAGGVDRADRPWNASAQHQSAYSSRRGSPGPQDGF